MQDQNSNAPSKREQILHLLQTTELSNEEIQKEVECSLEKVVNVASELQKGTGDVIEEILEKPAIKPIVDAVKSLIWKDKKDCGCNERKEKLNKIFGRMKPLLCLNEIEFDYLKGFFADWDGLVSPKPIVMRELQTIRARIFKIRFPSVSSCRKCIIADMRQLRLIYEQYQRDLDAE